MGTWIAVLRSKGTPLAEAPYVRQDGGQGLHLLFQAARNDRGSDAYFFFWLALFD